MHRDSRKLIKKDALRLLNPYFIYIFSSAPSRRVEHIIFSCSGQIKVTTDRITCCMQNMRQPLIMGLHFIWATTKQWPTANLVGHTANWPRVRVLRRVVVPGGWLGFCLLPPSRSWWWSWMGVLDYTSARLIESAPQKPHYAGALSPPSREG